MNSFRAIFAALLALVLVFASGLALLHLVNGTAPLASTLGLLLAAIAPMVFLVLHCFKPAKLKVPEPIVFGAISGLGLSITMASSWKHGAVAGHAHLWSGACLAAWFLYLKLYVRK